MSTVKISELKDSPSAIKEKMSEEIFIEWHYCIFDIFNQNYSRMTRPTNTKNIFLDYGGGTPIDPRVLSVVRNVEKKFWHNPSALYLEGVLAKKELEKLRKEASETLVCLPDEIVFTSSGTESNNFAIRGVISASKDKKLSVLFSGIDHPSTIETIKSIQNIKAVSLPTNEFGFMDISFLKKELLKKPILLSFNYVNGEIGTIENIKEIMKAVRFYRKTKKTIFPYVHIDASQAFNVLPIKLNELGVDLMTLSSDKVYGPKGVSLLFIRRGTKINPIITGGGQEGGMRSGTENLPAITGFVEAIKICEKERALRNKTIVLIQKKFLALLYKGFPKMMLNGPVLGDKRSPNNINVCIPSIDSEQAVLVMDKLGVKISFSSACKTLAERSNSYVIGSLNRENCATSSLRFSFNHGTKIKDIATVVKYLKKAVADSMGKKIKLEDTNKSLRYNS